MPKYCVCLFYRDPTPKELLIYESLSVAKSTNLFFFFAHPGNYSISVVGPFLGENGLGVKVIIQPPYSEEDEN